MIKSDVSSEHCQSIIISLATRCIVADDIQKHRPSWQSVMSKKGYSLLIDAIWIEALRSRSLNLVETRAWIAAIDTHLHK